jgi:hypothetical protein
MREIAAVAGLAIATAALASAFSASAQQAQMTLPEVVVAAPKATPTPAPYHAPRETGMLGNTRVEENQWPQIPCDSSRMNTAAGKCQDGPKVMSALSYMAGGERPNAYGDCTIVHPLVTAVIGRFAVEADVLVFDPYKVTAVPINSKCTVWSGYEHLPDDFKDMNQVARRGAGWRNFVQGDGRSGAQSTIEFADGGRNCLALERLGPYWHGGFVWVMHATMCEGGTTPIVQADIDAVAGALQIHTYDPVGNLRPPPKN